MLPRPTTDNSRRGKSELRFHDGNGDKFDWRISLSRIRRRIFNASSPSGSLQNASSIAGSDSSNLRAAPRTGPQNEKYLKERAREEQEEWTTDKTVVDSDFDGLHHAAGSSTPSDHGTSGPTRSRTAGIDASEFNDDRGVQRLWTSTVKYWNHFFEPSFADVESERAFQKERWYNTKFLAVVASGFIVLNWVLYLIFNRSVSLYEKWAYYGIATILTLPFPVLVALDFPVRHGFIFQVFAMLSTWQWGISEVIQTRVCLFFEPAERDCGKKDFLFMMTYSIVFPILVMFSCGQKRLYTAFAATVQFVLLCAIILPVETIFVRNVISYACFMGFFIYLHYYMEQIDRRMFVLRSQLKISYRAQQKAQMKEKQAANSKRRFISYIFHEVRVPLNSAMLAFQNMQTNNAFEHCKEDQAVEIHALEGSMAAMKQVLDDVLDLQRMDSGKFENKPQPFPFHRAVQSMLGSLKVSTAAKNLDLKVEFDERIDDVLSKAEAREEGVWVVGDPLRLRQVLTNFTSNAVKFTPEGQGEITVKTILIGGPRRAPSRRGFIQKGVNNDGNEFDREGDDTTADDSGPNIRRLESSFRDLEDPPFAEQELRLQENSIVIRIEVSDAGPGIRPSDAENLFEPFVQTQLGAAHAGRGSGLGLAIVRQIVTLSHGRLGFSSRKNKGSTFWVEFRYTLASNSEIRAQQEISAPALFNSSARGSPDTEAPPHGLTPLNDGITPSQLGSTPGTVTFGHSPGVNFAPETRYASYFERPADAGWNKPNLEVLVNAKAQSAPDNPVAFLPQLPLPLSRAETIAARPTSAETASTSIAEPETDRPLRVLVVDDDPLTRVLMSRMLTRLSADVSTANDGQHALDILLGGPDADDPSAPPNPPQFFDMVSLDNAMPILTGLQAVERLRSLGRDDFIVGATGNALKEDQDSYLAAGADRVLSKPIMMKDLKSMLQEALDRRNATKPGRS